MSLRPDGIVSLVNRGRPRLVVVDAPGGPHPRFYWPELECDYDLWVVCHMPGDRSEMAQRVRHFDGAHDVIEIPAPTDVRAAIEMLVAQAEPHGILALSERVIHEAQGAAWAVGLPANPPETLTALRDKRIQRRQLDAAGIPVPAQRELSDVKSCQAAAAALRFPLVVKPAIGMGGIATFRVVDEDDLVAHWQRASALAHADARIRHHDPVLVVEEELVGSRDAAFSGLGDFVSVEALSHADEMFVLSVTDKLPLVPPFREAGSLLPSVRDRRERDEIVSMARAALKALGASFGASHTELKLTPDGPRIIEINGRPGGGVAEMLRHAANYSYVGALARASIGERPPHTPRFTRFAANLHPQPPEGRHVVVMSPTEDALCADPRVVEVKALVREQVIVDSHDGTSSHVCVYDAVDESHSGLIELAREVKDSFVLHPADGDGGERAH